MISQEQLITQVPQQEQRHNQASSLQICANFPSVPANHPDTTSSWWYYRDLPGVCTYVIYKGGFCKKPRWYKISPLLCQVGFLRHSAIGCGSEVSWSHTPFHSVHRASGWGECSQVGSWLKGLSGSSYILPLWCLTVYNMLSGTLFYFILSLTWLFLKP